MIDDEAVPRCVLVLTPMPIELRPIVRRLGLRRSHGGLHRGRFGGAEVTAALVGVGPGCAARVVSSLLEDAVPDRVVIGGIAGGVGPEVKVGDLVVPEVTTMWDAQEATGTDARRSYRAAPLGQAELRGHVLTSGRILDRSTLESLASDGVDAVDMETAAVAAGCAGAGVPWTAFRGISDHFTDKLVDQSIVALVGADGRPDLRAVAGFVVRRPGNAVRLARLARGTAAATSVMAEAVASALLSDQKANS